MRQKSKERKKKKDKQNKAYGSNRKYALHSIIVKWPKAKQKEKMRESTAN